MFKKFLVTAVLCIAVATGIVLLWQGDAGAPTTAVQESVIPEGERGMVGATIPVVVSLFETSLQSSVTDSATSMTLVSGTDRAGSILSGYFCYTIDEGTSVAEFVCGSASSTAVTSMARGISPLTGTSTVSSLKFSHRRGASVKITNYPQLAIISRILNGNETLPNPIRYEGISTTTLSTNTNYLASVAYVNGVALQGAPTATGSTPGLLQIATRTDLSNGTAQSGAYTLVPSNAYFAYTPQNATSVPVSNASGKIAQGWLDLTIPWIFTNTSSTNLTISNLTNLATTTFSVIPTAPTTTPVSDLSLITKYQSLNLFRTASSSAVLQLSADTVAQAQGNTYTKRKDIIVSIGGTMSIKFDLASSDNANTVFGRIYINDVSVGTERSTNSSTYGTHTETLTVAPGDHIQIYSKCTNVATESAQIRNFRLNFDINSTSTPGIIVNN